MTFQVKNWTRISSSGNTTVVTLQDGTLQGAPTLFGYISGTDNIATINGADYFADQANELNQTDLIYVAATDGEVFMTVAGVSVGPPRHVTTTLVTPGTGDVDGPASAIANDIAVFNGTTGKVIKDGLISIGGIQAGTLIYAADGGGTDAYAITLNPVPAAYVAGMVINFKANTANTTGATLNVNGLGAKAILKEHDQVLATGDIEAGQFVTVIYDGTQWQMQSQLGQAPSNPYAVLQDGSPIYGADGGSTDTYAITLSPVPAAYTVGMVVNFKANTANTGNSTLNVNGLGAIPLVTTSGTGTVTGDILVGQIVSAIYNGTSFQIENPSAQAVNNLSSQTSAFTVTYVGNTVGLDQNLINTVGGRLTFTSGNPAQPGDTTGATTLYYTPYVGKDLCLYAGAPGIWQSFQPSEISIAIPAAANQMYDVFVFSNSGVITLELTAWASDTARVTSLVYQDGVLCKTGALGHRYLGSFRTDGSNHGTDAVAFRGLFNYYNRIKKPMAGISSTSTWTYTTATFRQADANGSNQLNFVVGVVEDCVDAFVSASANNAAAAGVTVGIGLNSTSVNSCRVNALVQLGAAASIFPVSANYSDYPGLGLNALVWLEYSSAAGSTTWYGQNAPEQSGIIGSVFC